MTAKEQFEELAARTSRTPHTEIEALFDSLPPVDEDFMFGQWSGGVFRTGHGGERALRWLNWVGKDFRSRTDVNPIISGLWGTRIANPVMGKASLRMIEYRGVVTATMVYDRFPVFDHFRKVDGDTVLGVMDRKGSKPLYFYLRRLP